MKVFKGSKGKYIIDFEGQEIDVDVDESVQNVDYCSKLFNGDVVSEVRNGFWLFGDKTESHPV